MLMLGKKELLIVLNINKIIRTLTQIFKGNFKYITTLVLIGKCFPPTIDKISARGDPGGKIIFERRCSIHRLHTS